MMTKVNSDFKLQTELQRSAADSDKCLKKTEDWAPV